MIDIKKDSKIVVLCMYIKKIVCILIALFLGVILSLVKLILLSTSFVVYRAIHLFTT
jgi:hypothetical protein